MQQEQKITKLPKPESYISWGTQKKAFEQRQKYWNNSVAQVISHWSDKVLLTQLSLTSEQTK